MSFGVFPNNVMTLQQKKETLIKSSQSGGWRQLKQDIAKFDTMRNSLVNDMENQRNPLFRRYVKMYKARLGPEAFLKNRQHVYAVCYQRCMQDAFSVDEVVDVSRGLEPQTESAVSSTQNADHQNAA